MATITERLARGARARPFRAAVCTAALALSTGLFATDTHAKTPFGPWNAGSSRTVHKHGKRGHDQHAHPPVGPEGKIPAEGPVPPPRPPHQDVPETPHAVMNRVGVSLSHNPLLYAALLYSNILTKIDGPRCQHYPTCSRFANQALAKHGVLGIPLGLQRVIMNHESSAVRWLPPIQVGTTRRYYDPVENHEFWKPTQFETFTPNLPENALELPAIDPDAAAFSAWVSDVPAAHTPNLGAPSASETHAPQRLQEAHVQNAHTPHTHADH